MGFLFSRQNNVIIWRTTKKKRTGIGGEDRHPVVHGIIERMYRERPHQLLLALVLKGRDFKILKKQIDQWFSILTAYWNHLRSFRSFGHQAPHPETLL